MKLVEHTVSQFVDVLASDAPAPGGGSAAALSAALGTALTKMVTELTIGKKKYADFEEDAKELRQQMTDLTDKFVVAIDKDTEAFNDVSAVFAMPKETEEDKAARRAAMQEALKGATKSPFEIMKLTVEALRLTNDAIGKTNSNAASDLGVSALSLKAGLQGAWLNVLINLDGVKDEDFVGEYRSNGQKLLDEGNKLADDIYNAIVSDLS